MAGLLDGHLGSAAQQDFLAGSHILTLWACFLQAAGWLAVLLPTQQVKQGGAHWNAWLADWMAIWGAQPNKISLQAHTF